MDLVLGEEKLAGGGEGEEGQEWCVEGWTHCGGFEIGCLRFRDVSDV